MIWNNYVGESAEKVFSYFIVFFYGYWQGKIWLMEQNFPSTYICTVLILYSCNTVQSIAIMFN